MVALDQWIDRKLADLAKVRHRMMLSNTGSWVVIITWILEDAPGLKRLWPSQSTEDFCVGFSIAAFVWVLLSGLKGLEKGFMGWVRAFAKGLIASSFLNGGIEAFQAGWNDGYYGLSSGVPPPTWSVFFQVLGGALVIMVLLRWVASLRAEAHRQRRAAEVSRQQVLAGRLAPHFIFNALNTVHAQIEVDPKGALDTTERLSHLFRQVLAVVDQRTIPLKQELEFVESYLGIEKVRLGTRLRVRIEVPEELEGDQLPPLALQVLVENAVKHGVAPLEAGGEIVILAKREGVALHLWVTDPGPGLASIPGTGTALETLRQRLDKPEDLKLERTERGFVAHLRWRQL